VQVQRNWLWVAVSLAAVQVVLLGILAASLVGNRPAQLTPALAIPVGERSSTVSLAPDGRRALVAGTGGQVQLVDTTTNTVLGTLGTAFVSDAIYAPDGRTAYVLRSSEIGVVDLTTNLITGRIALSGPAAGATRLLAVTPDGRRIIAARYGEATSWRSTSRPARPCPC
jgi:hypothetical protein